MDETLAEVRRIKEECARERLARTPEEQRRHSAEVMRQAEEMLGRPIRKARFSAYVKESKVGEMSQA
jgi:hypothetical protein